MLFLHPARLWLLLLIIPLIAVQLRPGSAQGGLRRAMVLLTHTLGLVALVLAFSRPTLDRQDRTRTLVAVVDVSASIDSGDVDKAAVEIRRISRARGPEESLRLVVFDRTARELVFTPQQLHALSGEFLRPPDAESPATGSALAEGLELAGALVRGDGAGRILLFGDGLETRGDARAAAERLGRRGIPVRVTPLSVARQNESILRAVRMPGSARVGATVSLEAEIESAGAATGRLVVAQEGEPETERPIVLDGGRQTLRVPVPLRKEGVSSVAVRLDVQPDTSADNNLLSASIAVSAPCDVRVVEEAEGGSAAAALGKMLAESAQVRSLKPADLAAPDVLAGANVLVLADVPADTLGPQVHAAIRSAVTGGLGLLVTGGRRSFGPGGYAQTPLADILPVRCAQKIERRDPSTTLVVIIDTSGSMGGARVSIAKEIARLSIARLTPHDKVGIVEFYGSKRWAAPIQPASNAIDLQRALNRLSSSGGTVIMPALEEAYYALQNVQTRTKHVLVLTDGGVETGAFETLIRKMADQGMTVSTVMVGPGAHSAFLSSLAQWGRGRFYAAPDRFNLPEVIIKQPDSSLLPPLVEQEVTLSNSAGDPVLDGIDLAGAPAITGYVETDARPTADVVLTSSLGHPILAYWRYGTGGVAAFTSQLGGDWSRDFGAWQGSGTLFANVVRSLAAPDARHALCITPVQRPGAIELQIVNQLSSSGASVAAVRVVVTGDDRFRRTWTLDPVLPDEWNLRVSGLPPGSYRVTAETEDGRLAGEAAVSVAPEREFSAVAPDAGLLSDLETLSAAPFAGVSQRMRARELWPALVVLAWLLLLLNVLIRRWPRRVRAVAAALALMFTLQAPGEVRAAESLAASAPATATKPAEQLPDSAATAAHTALEASDPATSELQLAEALQAVLADQGNPDALLHFFRARVDGNPHTKWALARCAASCGELQLARETLLQMTVQPSSDARVWAELARVEELSGNDKAALAAIEKALGQKSAPEQAVALRVRKALMLYDGIDREGASQMIRDLASQAGGDAAGAQYAAQIAALNGDNATAASILDSVAHGDKDLALHLFRGLFLLRLGRPADAQREFEQAYTEASLSRDRRFALERIVTAARAAGTLEQLADTWVATKDLSPDRLSALLRILRELGRSADALKLLERTGTSEQERTFIESPEFQREVIAAALAAGKASEAEQAYRRLLERNPEQVEWRVSLARLQLLDGRRDEAASVFAEGITRFGDASTLMALAEGARQLSLDTPALAAARKAAAAGPMEQVHATLFEAELARQRAEPDRALQLLRQLSARPGLDPRALQLVAEALERYGDKADALRLLRSVYDKTGAEDTLLRVAWLLEENQRYEEALELWKAMWATTQVPARLRQSQERMLDLAARTGRLADLAIELEERVASSTGGERDLSLLIEIYTTANDPISAAEILQDYGKRSGNQVEVLQRLARVYLSCEQFGRCNAVLHRLVALDPANASDYLQQIAIVALERKQPQQARQALDELGRIAGGGEIVDELSAGVLDMIGLHDEAARSYGRVLARHPDRIESLLLWANAMRDAGQADRAIARLQVIVEEAPEDDLFTVAVDGLLNLQARPAVLTSALRRVCARIAAAPHKVFLYQLAVDLLEQLGRPQRMTEVLEQAVVVAGERRSALLRELMESARADGRSDDLIRFGSSLVALGDEVPPQVFLDLGEAMIKQGELVAAERVFERASLAGDFAAIQQRVAGYYEDANMPGDADRIIRQLLISDPDSVQLLIRSGTLSEQLGTYERAFAQYYHAADLMLRRLPGALRAEATSAPATATAERTVRRATNVDEMGQFFDSAGNGLLNAARTPQLREQLRTDLLRRIDEELAVLQRENRVMPTLARNPRLERLARFLRQVAFSLHVPEAADQIDSMLMQRYPQDKALRALVVQTRLEWGLYARAGALGRAGGAELPLELQIASWMAEPAQLDTRIASGLDLPTGARVTPLLIAMGREEQARAVLRGCRVKPPVDAAQVESLIVCATALDDTAAMQQWLGIALDSAASQRKGSQFTSAVEKAVRLVWNRLGEQDRKILVERLGRMAGELGSAERLQLDLIRMSLAQAAGAPLGDTQASIEAGAQDASLGAETALTLLRLSTPERRPSVLRTMLTARKPPAQRAFLLGVAGGIESADEQLVQTIVAGFEAAPKQRFESASAYTLVSQSAWNRNRRCPEVGRKLGEILLGESTSETPVLVAVAVARETAGAHDEALPLAREALEALLAVKKIEHDHKRMIDSIAEILRPDEIEAALADLQDRMQIEQPAPALLFAKGLLMEGSGRRADAITAFRAAFEMAPSQNTYSRKIISALRQSGRHLELAELLSKHLTKSTIMESYEWRTLTELNYDLWRLPDAMRAAQRDETALAPVDMMRIARRMGRPDDVRTIFRRFLTRNRDDGRFYTPFWPAESSPGGIPGFIERTEVPMWKRARLFEALADLPFAEEEFQGLLLAARPERKDIPGLIDGIRRATRLNGTRGELARQLAEAIQRDALTVKDRQMILAIAQEDPAALPEPLLAAADEILVHADPADTVTLTTLARFFQARNRTDRARSIFKWVIAADVLDGRTSSRMDNPFDRLDAYLSLLGEQERHRVGMRFLADVAPTPVDALSDAFDAARLDRLAGAVPAAEFEAELQRVRSDVEDDRTGWRYRGLRAALARRDAAAGRVEAFARQVNVCFRAARSESIYEQHVDPGTMLPPVASIKQPEACIDAIIGAIASARADRALGGESATCSLSLLAAWCFRSEMAAKGAEVLQQAEAGAGDPGEHWLWIADAVRAGGQQARAFAIEEKLLASGMLPIVRVPDLLTYVASARGEAAAGEMAAGVARYSDHPIVLQRAAAWAEARGEKAAAEAIRKRLPATATLPASRAAP